ncbi:LPXTG cell wall anchor domain-containing protein [Heyndrickxia sp. MSNUG]|uniref:LPXTG cell wall anchor domain-containing protein n=1 Tax=Heyndrickxia sp. MSNUG TaxID=3136677 RepID=UPI003C2F272F
MKPIKHVSILLSLMLLLFISLPVTGAFAAGSAESQTVKNSKQSSQVDSKKKSNQAQTEAAKPKAQNENTANSNNNNTEGNSAVKKEAAQIQQADHKEKAETKVENDQTVEIAKNEKETKTKVETVSEKVVNTNKSTQIHLHLKDCVNPTVSVFVELKGEWKEMSNPGSSPLFKLLDGGEFVKDDVTAFKLVFEGGEELVVPVSEIKVGVEAEGTINYWLENCDLPDSGETAPDKDANKSTQIHLHVKDCISPAAKVFVEIKGEWKEMTHPGKSPLFKLLDGGEFVTEDITAFKIVFTSGGELVVPVSDLKIGVEAEGTINYWMEKCDIPLKNTFKTLSLMIDDSKGKIDSAAVIMMNGKRIEFKLVNHVWTIHLTEEAKMDMLKGLELTSNGQTKVIPLTQLSEEMVHLENQVLTLKVNWSMQGEIVGEETNEGASPVPMKNSGSGNTPGGSTGSQGWVGGDVLPQTGESSRMPYYILGFLIAAGGVMLRIKNPLKN